MADDEISPGEVARETLMKLYKSIEIALYQRKIELTGNIEFQCEWISSATAGGDILKPVVPVLDRIFSFLSTIDS